MKEVREKVKVVTLLNPRTQEEEEKYMMSLKVLGEGKYGKVYRATHIDQPDKVFAVKVIRLETQKIRKECLEELEVIKHLPKSKFLVQIHPQHLESEDNFYLFEEYCEGGTLHDMRKLRKGKPFTQDQVFNIYYQVVQGFLSLRKADIFHQDIKPQNILIKNGIFKLTDFGISKLASKTEITAVRKGTLIYMPPEKLKLSKYVPTSKSEIFALGVTLYEVIFGEQPYVSRLPKDYKDYLLMLQAATPKSINYLKEYFPNASIGIDKLIRNILKMIELTEAKRMSLEELQEYVTDYEPFKSMVIEESPTSMSKIYRVPKVYEQVGHSKVLMRETLPKEGLLTNTSKETKNFMVECFKITFGVVRSISSFMEQGVLYAKESSITQFQKQLGHQYNNIHQYEYLEFLITYLNDYMFEEVNRASSRFILEMDIEDFEQLNSEHDLTYVKNQFLKVLTGIDLPNKKELRQRLKEEGNAVAEVSSIMGELYTEIDCVRIHFKEDLLAVLFAKNAATVLKFVDRLLQELKQQNGIINIVQSDEFTHVKEVLKDYCECEAMKADALLAEFREEMGGEKDFLEDDKSNSDEFEVLEFIDE